MPIMLTNKPIIPTISTLKGSFNSLGSSKCSIDSRKMEKHKANKKTPFTKAPKTSARTHPNVFVVDFRRAI
jgi:hypothetical protein